MMGIDNFGPSGHVRRIRPVWPPRRAGGRGRCATPVVRPAVAALALMALIGCRDTLQPDPSGASVEIYLSDVAADEQTIAVDATLHLTARVLDAGGKTIQGETADWSSTDPGVASVDVSGYVTGHAVGGTFIVAQHDAGADSVRINVAEGISADIEPDCEGIADLPIGAGDVLTLGGDQAHPLCLPGGATGAAYTIALVNTGTTSGSTIPVYMDAADIAEWGTAGAADRRLTRRPELALQPFHRHLRVDVSRELEPRLKAGVSAAEFAPGMLVAPGSKLSFNVETLSSDGCQNPVQHGGRVQAVSDRAIIVADTLNPAGGYTLEEYEDFADFFDDEAWPLITESFGTPSDIDGNERVIIFFTRAVNDLPPNSPDNPSAFVGGFFFNRDLFPTSTCAGSNEAEMFYVLVPNPDPTGSERRFSKEFVNLSTRNVLAHEFQHLVNDSRRLHVNKAPEWEETWLNEGLSHIAEELMFYRVAGLAPRSNLGPLDFVGPIAHDAFRFFQIENMKRLAIYLRAPENASLMGADILATRGATWSFLRYAADRHGGAETAFWNALSGEATTTGLENLGEVLGEDVRPWIRDWAAALYLDDTGVSNDPRYDNPSWNFRDLFPAAETLWPGQTSDDEYPLMPRPIYAGYPVVLPIQGGGAAFVRVNVEPGEHGAVRFLTGSNPLLPAPERLQLVISRAP